MFRLLSIALLFILVGCAPHFYEAKSLRVDAKNIQVVSSGELNFNCISSSEIPLIYVLKRALYTIEFSVSALQVGMKFTHPDASSYTFSSLDLKENDSFVTGLNEKYTHYVSTLEPRDITIGIIDKANEVGSELLSLSIVSCKAILIDAI